jgi:hypothetical protein
MAPNAICCTATSCSAASTFSFHSCRPPDPANRLLMGGMCHLTAVWLFYRRPYDLVQRGEELFDRIELSFLAGGGSRGVEASRRPARSGGLSSFVRRRYHERQEADRLQARLRRRA